MSVVDRRTVKRNCCRSAVVLK